MGFASAPVYSSSEGAAPISTTLCRFRRTGAACRVGLLLPAVASVPAQARGSLWKHRLPLGNVSAIGLFKFAAVVHARASRRMLVLSAVGCRGFGAPP